MEQFFTGTNRRIILGSPTLQSTTRRICIPIRMPLTGESVIGMPSWLGDAYTAVSKFASDMTPEVEQIADITLAFDNQKPKDALFEMPAAKVPQAELRAFNVTRAGDSEEPDVELAFKAYTPYARDFWAWLGEMAGKEVFMAFPSSLGGTVKAAPAEQTSFDPQPSADEAAILAKDTKPEDGPGTAKYEAQVRESMGAKAAGPRMVGDTPREQRKPRKSQREMGKELAEYHARESEKEAKGERGKVSVN